VNSQLFFLLNLVFGVIFLIWFLSSRRDGKLKPTQLKMKTKDNAAQPAPLPGKIDAEMQERQKSLNIFFIYNGHDWDAYEVLGVPAGARLSDVTAQYQKMIISADRGQHEFLEAAYRAILNSRGKR
jgi:hypothetical protein